MYGQRRRRCCMCGLLTRNWQRINGGSWHCYDGCYSTTGRDKRTDDGKPLWEKTEEERDRLREQGRLYTSA